MNLAEGTCFKQSDKVVELWINLAKGRGMSEERGYTQVRENSESKQRKEKRKPGHKCNV
jgi:hypothetical protein